MRAPRLSPPGAEPPWHDSDTIPSDPTILPPDLPQPVDDGGADHLPGAELPDLAFPATTGGTIALRDFAAGMLVLFVYPEMGRPDAGMPAGWDAIPGARGCTPQACRFRDLAGELEAVGARLAGLSAQPAEEQREAAARLDLSYPLLADPELRLRAALDLPTFSAAGRVFYKRLTLVARAGVVVRVFYPVFPPDRNADDVLAWLAEARG